MLGGPCVFKAGPGNQCIHKRGKGLDVFSTFLFVIIFVLFFWLLYIHVITLYRLISKEATDRQSSQQA